MSNRLKEFMESNKITVEKFSEKYGYSDKSIKNYRNGESELPPELACKIADDYNISLDWLYGRSSFLDDSDIIAYIILALSKVFQYKSLNQIIKKNGEVNYCPCRTLLIEEQFFNFILDIKELEHKKYCDKKAHKIIADDAYKADREKIYSKYKDYFRELFGITGFNEEKAKEVINDIEVFNILP